MAAKYLMFRNAGTSSTVDSGNTGNAEPNATSACWPVSSFLGGFGRYLNRGGSSPHDALQMYVTLFFKPQRSGGIAASSDQALLSDSVQIWLNNNDGYRPFLEQLFEAIENHNSSVLNVFDSCFADVDAQGFGGRNLSSIAGIYEMKITVDNS